ncbi:MAG: sigma-54 dependent transcriptional regulator [Pseudomonadota bacterium]
MDKKKTILVIDDDNALRRSICLILGELYQTIEAIDYESSLSKINSYEIDLVILDLNFDEEKNGIDVLKYIKSKDKTTPIIILSSITETEKVVECISLGAFDYITKSVETLEHDLLLRIEKALKTAKTLRSFESMRIEFKDKYEIISQNKIILEIMKEIQYIDDMNLLIEGETGVGKTPIARYTNSCLSNGVKRPFVRVNCAGLSRERLQDILFGHKKGAYTGAESDLQGLVELAKDGDLFLDEIGDLNFECQAELLMFLDCGEYRRLGDPIVRHSNCRIISATNYSLKRRVIEGKFRQDLYSRLSPCKVRIPALRERKEDIIPIMEYYIMQFCGFLKPVTTSVKDLFLKNDWLEGNVRELKDAVQYMCQKSKQAEQINIEHLSPIYFLENKNIAKLNSQDFNMHSVKEDVMIKGLDTYLDAIERQVLEEISQGERSIRSLAMKLNAVEVTLYRKFKKHGLTI